MKMCVKFITLAIIATGLLLSSGVSFSAKGGIPGPPPGGEVSNNLSFPAVLPGSTWTTPASWAPLLEPELGVHYSYGCDKPEDHGNFSFPNTSCVDDLSEPTVFYTAEQCTAISAPCDGLPVSRIYWQKVSENEWSADEEGALSSTPEFPERIVTAINWGDALEAVSWNERSVIRVEAQPYFSLIDGFDPTLASCEDAAIAAGLDETIVCKVGFQMWHVSGHGITEHWGVRANDPGELDENNSFNYDSPFQIIKSTDARLNLTKMEPDDALCPQPGGNPGEDPPIIDSEQWNGNGWDGTCELMDAPFTIELSVSGKYVYGFNWRIRDAIMSSLNCPDAGDQWLKTGFWRLTFYTPGDIPEVIFDDEFAPNVAPFEPPSQERALPRSWFIDETLPPLEPPAEAVMLLDGMPVIESDDPTEDDRLYIPVIDTVNNLSYLDICVVAKTTGNNPNR